MRTTRVRRLISQFKRSSRLVERLLARAPTEDELEGLLDHIVARLMKLPTRRGYLVEEQGMTYLADTDDAHSGAIA